MDPVLGRKVLTRIEDDAAFDMDLWICLPARGLPADAVVSRTNMCGTSACIGGHVLLEAGYTFSGCWRKPDGDRLTDAISGEARHLLQLTPEEYMGTEGTQDDVPLFFDDRPDAVVRERFRALVEAAEARAAMER